MTTEAAATETPVEEKPVTEKVFSIKDNGYIDKPVDGNPTISAETAKLLLDGSKPAEEVKAEVKPAEEVKKEEVKPEDKPLAFEPGTYLKEKFGEKFGIESEQELQEILDSQDALVEKFTELQTKYKELENNPTYRTDQEKKIAEFLKPYDPTKFGEGLNSIAAIIGMDPAAVSGRTAMEEAYIINHPDLTRDEAKELFTEEYDVRFKLNKDDFDTDEAYNQRKRINDIKLKNEEANARKILVEKKELLKAKPEEKQTATQENKPIEVPAEVTQKYTQEIEKFFNPEKNKTFDRFQFKSDDGKETLYEMILDKKQLAELKGFMSDYYKNPNNYSKDGKTANFAPQELVGTASRLLHGDWREQQLWKQVKVLAQKMKAEQIAGTSTEKKSSGGGDMKMSVTDQFIKLGQQEQAKRQR